MARFFLIICWALVLNAQSLFSLDLNIASDLFEVSFDDSMARVFESYKAIQNKSDINARIISDARVLYDTLRNITPADKPKIPKIMHTVWLGKNFPALFHMYKVCWMQKHPHWTHILWVDDSSQYVYGQEIKINDDNIKKIYEGAFEGKLIVLDIRSLNLINKQLYAQVSDHHIKSQIARYEIISQFGGIFVNADCQCFKSFDSLNHRYDFFAGISSIADRMMVSDALFGARPNHPIIDYCVQAMTNQLDLKKINFQLTDSFLACKNQSSDINIIFPPSYFFPIKLNQKNLSEDEKSAFVRSETFNVYHWQEMFYNNASNDNRHVIGLFQSNEGLFSALKGVMHHLTYCVRFNKVPVVIWNNESSYYQPEGYRDQTNVWQYYFEPVSAATYHENDYIWKTYGTPDNKGFIIELESSRDKRFRRLIKNAIINPFIRIKPYILEKVDNFFCKYMKAKRTIGIHMRGTDRVQDLKKVSFENIIDRANQFANETTQFFIATDDQELLSKAKKLLKGDVIAYESYRSTDGLPIHYGNNNCCSKAMLGEQALIEVLLLAKCEAFIHTISNFSYAALLFNPELESICLS